MSDAPPPQLPAAPDEDYPAPKERRRDELDLDITSMIDVVFLLLIFFMVSSTMQTPAPADAPPAANGEGLESAGAITLVLLPEVAGEFELELPDGETIPVSEAIDGDRVKSAVGAIYNSDPTRREVVLLIDRDTPVGEYLPVMRQLADFEGLDVRFEVQDPR